MSVNIIDFSNAKEGEKGVLLKKLCKSKWEMPEQVEALESWLKENKEKIKKGSYVADIGFSPREGALGGGAVLTLETMEIMVSVGMVLFLSEYPSSES